MLVRSMSLSCYAYALCLRAVAHLEDEYAVLAATDVVVHSALLYAASLQVEERVCGEAFSVSLHCVDSVNFANLCEV